MEIKDMLLGLKTNARHIESRAEPLDAIISRYSFAMPVIIGICPEPYCVKQVLSEKKGNIVFAVDLSDDIKTALKADDDFSNVNAVVAEMKKQMLMPMPYEESVARAYLSIMADKETVFIGMPEAFINVQQRIFASQESKNSEMHTQKGIEKRRVEFKMEESLRGYAARRIKPGTVLFTSRPLEIAKYFRENLTGCYVIMPVENAVKSSCTLASMEFVRDTGIVSASDLRRDQVLRLMMGSYNSLFKQGIDCFAYRRLL